MIGTSMERDAGANARPSRSLVERLDAATDLPKPSPGLGYRRAATTRCGATCQAVAGGWLAAVGAVERRRPMSPLRVLAGSRRISSTGARVHGAGGGDAVARRNSPWPHSRKFLTTVVAKDEPGQEDVRSPRPKAFRHVRQRCLVPARQRLRDNMKTAVQTVLMAASTARRSTGGFGRCNAGHHLVEPYSMHAAERDGRSSGLRRSRTRSGAKLNHHDGRFRTPRPASSRPTRAQTAPAPTSISS